MRSWNSPAPTGNENETTFAQGVVRKLKSELQFYDSTTITVEQTTRGVRFHARPSRRGTSGPSAPQVQFGIWNQATAYQPGFIVVVQTQQVIGAVTVVPGTYGCVAATNAGASGNMLPQFPIPNGTVYWILIALGVTPVNVCSAGNKTIYINASSAF